MLKYQLDKPELLINTDWGLPINDLSASDAQAQGLVKLNDRWTTPEDKKRLKVEHRVYSWIHLTILLTTIGGVVNSLVTAYHLRRYEPFGRACAMVLGALNVIGVVVLFFERGMASGASLAVCWHVVWSIAIARLFFSPIGNIVFSGKAKAAPAPIERKEEVA
jgi:FtsH-binding integral membrane protein